MIVIWSPALLGILFKLTIAHRFKVLSLVTYLTMGWLSLIVVYQLAIKLAVGRDASGGGRCGLLAGRDFLRLQAYSVQPCHLARFCAGRQRVSLRQFICMLGRCSFCKVRSDAHPTLSHRRG